MSITGISARISSLGQVETVSDGQSAAAGQNSSTIAPAAPKNEDAAIVTLSPEASVEQSAETNGKPPAIPAGAEENTQGGKGKSDAQKAEEAKKKEDARVIAQLKERDREVRAHEQAHLNALGSYKTGGATYQYTTGPDGKQYAVGGEVSVDLSPGASPAETIKKAETIKRAALAPAEPSGADRSVAAAAGQLIAQARAELAEQKTEEASGSEEGEKTGEASEGAESEKVQAAESSETIARVESEDSGENGFERDAAAPLVSVPGAEAKDVAEGVSSEELERRVAFPIQPGSLISVLA